MTLLPRSPFCLIRHGQTEANRDGIISGRLETVLTEQGRSDAARLATLDWPDDIAVFASPQGRARVTAELGFPAIPPRIIEELRERDWGVHDGRPLAELPPRTATPDQGESWSAMLDRVAIALGHCIQMAGKSLPVIVSHSGVIRATRALIGTPFDGPSAPNTTPIIFQPTAQGWVERPFFAAREQA
ncbi:histidine phosphatase family protein [Paracoccus sp. MBLB3053]|uniref:Histidine phosphatase family protein n=1 Tax=Paracoccus aurantius TaxID=3073814 RepID=A0ABU2I0I0_9RHOB|nr:histidine phosphatase family protein [Paracoccus sp. MBLB3053]MDS9470044.1 histidine phosphatase family protein [Paracoccus sp. MBLB3053]